MATGDETIVEDEHLTIVLVGLLWVEVVILVQVQGTPQVVHVSTAIIVTMVIIRIIPTTVRMIPLVSALHVQLNVFRTKKKLLNVHPQKGEAGKTTRIGYVQHMQESVVRVH